MTTRPWLACAVILYSFAGGVAPAVAASRCADCGCQTQCCKVCRCVPTTKKVTKVTYDCQCEDFCVPGKSEHCLQFDQCGEKRHVYTPTCAEVRTRKLLVKKETVTEEPTVKWVVDDLCAECQARCHAPSDATEPAGQPAGHNAGASLRRRAGGQLAVPAPLGETPAPVSASTAAPRARPTRGGVLPAWFRDAATGDRE